MYDRVSSTITRDILWNNEQ